MLDLGGLELLRVPVMLGLSTLLSSGQDQGMALIECYECEKEISDKAPTCPHCGAPAGGYDFPSAASCVYAGGPI